MNNIYLIYGNEEYLIKKELSKIINDSNVIEDNIIRYNLNEVNVIEVLDEASTISMFDSNKLIICEDCSFLTGDNKKEINHDIESLIKYINNPFNDVYLIFIVKREKLDERKKIVKELKKHSKVIECRKIESHDLNNYIYKYFQVSGYNIDMNLVRMIVDKVKYDLANIINECDKLMLYKDTDKNITKEDIDNIIIENMEDDIFSLANSILEKDKNKSIKIYKDLLLKGEEPIKLLVMVANQFRLILQVKLMLKNGYKQIEMANIIKEHPYRVKLALGSNYEEKELISNIKKLYKLDHDIKIGEIDKNFGFELFLLS
ncbi:MAG: DNA polymerase III subunit delta [Bacilli bacterium]|nr:DNA polymerase III subunit delta [Bacilli bacterium]